MKIELFRRSGVFFIPEHVVGWLIAAGAAAYCVWAFFDIDSRSHSASDTLINRAFTALIVGAVYSTIGFVASAREREGGESH